MFISCEKNDGNSDLSPYDTLEIFFRSLNDTILESNYEVYNCDEVVPSSGEMKLDIDIDSDFVYDFQIIKQHEDLGPIWGGRCHVVNDVTEAVSLNNQAEFAVIRIFPNDITGHIKYLDSLAVVSNQLIWQDKAYLQNIWQELFPSVKVNLYIGFRLKKESDYKYGWLQVIFPFQPYGGTRIVLCNYAYNNVNNRGISVRQIN